MTAAAPSAWRVVAIHSPSVGDFESAPGVDRAVADLLVAQGLAERRVVTRNGRTLIEDRRL